MKAKELAALLLKHPEVEVKLFTDGLYDVGGVIYEDDGLELPKIMVATKFRSDNYDEDYEHGFHVTP